MQALDTGLYNAFGQAQVSVIYTPANQYYVVLEVRPEYWQSPDGLDVHLLAASSERGTSAASRCVSMAHVLTRTRRRSP